MVKFCVSQKNSNIAIVNYTLTIETIQNTKIYSFCCHFLLTTLNKSLNILMSATTPFLHLFRTEECLHSDMDVNVGTHMDGMSALYVHIDVT
jgi:hypothetical protein